MFSSKPSTKRLSDKVAIVTGGGAGIGEAIAHKFAVEGAQVVVNGLPGDPVEDVVKTINANGGKAVAHLGDISDEAAAKECVELAVAEFGRLDVLVNNAGTLAYFSDTAEFEIAEFERHMKWNCRGVFLMTRFALPHLLKTKGNIISAGSEAGFNGLVGNATYGGTKAWIHAFMKGVAAEQGKHGIRANCVCPGPIDTALTRKEFGPMDKKTEKTVIGANLFGRRGTPEEVANVYVFLASDEASYVTGALWLVDGGITIAHGMPGQEAHRSVTNEPAGELRDLKHSFDGMKGKELAGKH